MRERSEPDPGEGEDPGTDATAPPSAPGWRHRRGLIATAVVGVVVIAAIATYLVLLRRVHSEPVSIDEARRRAGAEALGADQSATGTRFRPAAGVYRYRGEGTERLDKPPTSQSQGPDIPGTVTHLEGRCWRLRVDYNTNHWQSWDYCPTDTGLTETAGSFFQRLDLVVVKVETTSGYACIPPVDAIRPDQQPGDEWTHECRGTSTSASGEVVSAGPYTYLGPEDLDVGESRVAALHYRRLRTLTGGQSGTEDINVWFDAETALPLRNERVISVHSDSLIGGVTYEEKGSFALESLAPAG